MKVTKLQRVMTQTRISPQLLLSRNSTLYVAIIKVFKKYLGVQHTERFFYLRIFW